MFGGGAVFWQIDEHGKIRTGKIMGYDKTSGKRIKKPYNQFNWAHNVITPESDYNLSQCLFGLHLLPTSNCPVIIVESEKTAMLIDMVIPDVVVLASGGSNNLSAAKCKVLIGRKVVLIPDNSQFEKWTDIAEKILKPICKSVHVSAIMEQNGIESGADIGDLIVEAITTGGDINGIFANLF